MAEPAEEPSEAISTEDEPIVTRERQKILGYLGIFGKFWGYLENF